MPRSAKAPWCWNAPSTCMSNHCGGSWEERANTSRPCAALAIDCANPDKSEALRSSLPAEEPVTDADQNKNHDDDANVTVGGEPAVVGFLGQSFIGPRNEILIFGEAPEGAGHDLVDFISARRFDPKELVYPSREDHLKDPLHAAFDGRGYLVVG